MKTIVMAAFALVIATGTVRADPLDGKLDDCDRLLEEAADALKARNFPDATAKSSDASACYRGKLGIHPDLKGEWANLVNAIADHAMAFSYLARWEETANCPDLDRAEDMVVAARENLKAGGTSKRAGKVQGDLKKAEAEIAKGRKKCDAPPAE